MTNIKFTSENLTWARAQVQIPVWSINISPIPFHVTFGAYDQPLELTG